MDCSPPGSSVHGNFQARTLDWVAISSSRGFSRPRDWTVSPVFPALTGRFFTCWAIGEGKPLLECISVQFSHSVVSDSLQPHGLQHTRPLCPSPIPRVSQTHVHWVGDAIQPSLPLSSTPAFNLSQHQGLFQLVRSWHQVAKVWEFQLWHQSFQWIFRTDLLWDGLVVSPCCPRTLKSLLQHHSTKASILRCSAFYIVQISHPYITTAKTIALTKATFVGKVMSLLFNMLSRLIIVFLPRSKCLLISWLQSLSAVILSPRI